MHSSAKLSLDLPKLSLDLHELLAPQLLGVLERLGVLDPLLLPFLLVKVLDLLQLRQQLRVDLLQLHRALLQLRLALQQLRILPQQRRVLRLERLELLELLLERLDLPACATSTGTGMWAVGMGGGYMGAPGGDTWRWGWGWAGGGGGGGGGLVGGGGGDSL